MKNFTRIVLEKPLLPQDILHEDGSKSYGNINGGHIKIQRPEVVSIVDKILQGNHMGYSYMPTIIDLQEKGLISEEEVFDVIRILD
jgi:hypothetical protein